MLPLSENALDELVARERERGTPPLTDWNSLAEKLRAEGLIRDQRSSSPFAGRRWMQAAAALILVAGGAALGRIGVPEARQSAAGSAAAPSPAGESALRPVRSSVNASLASSPAPDFNSPEQAWDVLNRAGEEYQRASAYLSASNTEIPMPASPSQYRTRLAALDNVMSEMQDALKQSPQDPVINQYYLATVGAREATLRQLGTTLPAGARLNRF